MLITPAWLRKQDVDELAVHYNNLLSDRTKALADGQDARSINHSIYLVHEELHRRLPTDQVTQVIMRTRQALALMNG